MLLPSKITPFKISILSRLSIVLEEIMTKDILVIDLFNKVRNSFNNTTDFLDTLDCLFALNKIELIEESKVRYVDEN